MNGLKRRTRCFAFEADLFGTFNNIATSDTKGLYLWGKSVGNKRKYEQMRIYCRHYHHHWLRSPYEDDTHLALCYAVTGDIRSGIYGNNKGGRGVRPAMDRPGTVRRKRFWRMKKAKKHKLVSAIVAVSVAAAILLTGTMPGSLSANRRSTKHRIW